MTDEVRIYTRGLVWTLGKHVDILFEEFYQLLLLSRRQFSRNLEEFLRVIKKNYPL